MAEPSGPEPAGDPASGRDPGHAPGQDADAAASVPGGGSDGSGGGVRLWQIAVGVLGLVTVVLLLVLVLGGGDHGPQRHAPPDHGGSSSDGLGPGGAHGGGA